MRIRAIAVASIVVAGALVEAAAAAEAAAPAVSAIPCTGVWKLNEQLTHRTRTSTGPILEFFAPWGKNGWIRVDAGDEGAQFYQVPGWHFEQFDGKPYQVFGGDPNLQSVQKFNDRIFMVARVLPTGQKSDPVFWAFSKDCKRATYLVPEGQDRHAPIGQNTYYNELRVFERIEPPEDGAVAVVVADIFGGWELNRAASKLTLQPMDAETVIIIPWGRSGWVWNQLSGGSYQPEELRNGVKRVECGAASGPASVTCQGPPSNMMLYWATWDSKTFPTYGARRAQIQVKQVNDRTFEATLSRNTQTTAQADNAMVALSADGRRLTVTTRSVAANGDDVRVYDRIEADNWPSVTP